MIGASYNECHHYEDPEMEAYLSHSQNILSVTYSYNGLNTLNIA